MYFKNYVNLFSATPGFKLANPVYNARTLIDLMRYAYDTGVEILVTPELGLTGVTCGDLLSQDRLLAGSAAALQEIAQASVDYPQLVTLVGAPFLFNDVVYSTAFVISRGQILGAVPQLKNPSAVTALEPASLNGYHFPFGQQLFRFYTSHGEPYRLGVIVGRQPLFTDSLATRLAAEGATVLANLLAIPVSSDQRSISELISAQSVATSAICLAANAGSYESTADNLFIAETCIACNGEVIKSCRQAGVRCWPNRSGSQADVALGEFYHLAKSSALVNLKEPLYLRYAAAKSTFSPTAVSSTATPRSASLFVNDTTEFWDDENEGSGKTDTTGRTSTMQHPTHRHDLSKNYPDPRPFVQSKELYGGDALQAVENQAVALAERLRRLKATSAVLGISGGLDSTLSLLITARAFDMLGLPRRQIICLTLPGFGTSNQTYKNACELIETVGASFKEINIQAAVKQHFADIDLPEGDRGVTYENAQARERTQILMDIANMHNGPVIGTGDLSELALGWCTYNGDHMSMYGVNGSFTKTMIRYFLACIADQPATSPKLADVLKAILATPVSPELLPPSDDGAIAQHTEKLAGPYDLHDYFLYHTLKYGTEPQELYNLACGSFSATTLQERGYLKRAKTAANAPCPVTPETADLASSAADSANSKDSANSAVSAVEQFVHNVQPYTPEEILHWLNTFYRRFLTQQFKRNCMPDGAKTGNLSLSPRGSFAMPSDLDPEIWQQDLAELNARCAAK